MKKLHTRRKKGEGMGLKHFVVLLAVVFAASYCRYDGTSSRNSGGSGGSGTVASSEATWYVDPAAPAGGNGLSPDSAFRSITEAIYPNNPQWDAGDDIVLLAGSYSERVTLDLSQLPVAAGYAGNPMVIRAEAGAVFYAPMKIIGGKYLRLENLVFSDVTGEALVIEGAEGVVITGCDIRRIYNDNSSADPSLNVPGNGMRLENVSGATIENCYIDTVDASGVVIRNSGSVVVKTSDFISAGDSAVVVDSSNKVELRDSSFVSSWIGLQIRGTSDDVYVFHCAARGNNFAGVATSFDPGFQPATPLKVERTIVTKNGVGFYFSNDRYTTVLNPTVAYNTNAGVVISRTVGFTMTNAIVVFNDDGIADYAGTAIDSYIDYLDLYGNTGSDLVNVVTYSNVIHADPYFTDSDLNDYSLTATSPCIDAGDPNVTPPAGGEPVVDLGAIEYIKDSGEVPLF